MFEDRPSGAGERRADGVPGAVRELRGQVPGIEVRSPERWFPGWHGPERAHRLPAAKAPRDGSEEPRAGTSLGGLLLCRTVLALVLIARLVRQLFPGSHRSSLPARLPCSERSRVQCRHAIGSGTVRRSVQDRGESRNYLALTKRCPILAGPTKMILRGRAFSIVRLGR